MQSRFGSIPRRFECERTYAIAAWTSTAGLRGDRSPPSERMSNATALSPDAAISCAQPTFWPLVRPEPGGPPRRTAGKRPRALRGR